MLLVFIHFLHKTSEDISKILLSKLKDNSLDIMDCKGQACDNATAMALTL